MQVEGHLTRPVGTRKETWASRWIGSRRSWGERMLHKVLELGEKVCREVECGHVEQSKSASAQLNVP